MPDVSVCMDGSVSISLSLSLSPVVDIEELTRKTGNFKQFRVFINMLESAIKKVGHLSMSVRKKGLKILIALHQKMKFLCPYTIVPFLSKNKPNF